MPPSTLRRAATIVLVVGTIISVAAAFGPVWVVRLGVVVAVAAAVIATLLAWREVRADRRRHAAAMLASTRAHGETLRTERAHNSGVLQVVTERNVAALGEISRQQTVIAQLRGEVSSLKGDRAALSAEITRRQEVIASLQDTVRAREAELAALLEDVEGGADDDAEGAHVHAMPRRVRVDQVGEPGSVASAELWTDDTTPHRRRPGSERPGLRNRGEPVLPNYEEDRRLA